MTRSLDAIVIGAGHNGLSCATYLARKGLKVLCLDANPVPGGLASRHNFGEHYSVPSLAPFGAVPSKRVIDELALGAAGYQNGPIANTLSLDTNGQHLALTAEGLTAAKLSETDKESFRTFSHQVRAFSKTLQPMLMTRPPRLKHMDGHDKRTLARLGWNLRATLGRDNMNEFLRMVGSNIYDVLDDSFTDERLKALISTDAVMGNAMGPRTPGSVLTWLCRSQLTLDAARTVNASDKSELIQALLRSAEANGCELRLNSSVTRITTSEGNCSGIELSTGERVLAPCVISSADPRHTFLELLGARKLDAMFANRVKQIRGDGVVAKLHLGLSRLPNFDGVNEQQLSERVLIAPSMRYAERAFNACKHGEYSTKPIIEFTVPSLHNEALAPHGHHVLSANIAYVPYALKGGWNSEARATVRKHTVDLIGQYSSDLHECIVASECLTPKDLERMSPGSRGHWHHGDMSMHQSLMLRPVYGAAQYDTPLPGLYLCGAGTHPGGDLLGLAGLSAAQRVVEREPRL
ncbi:MAG: NAD(P)/FAD-dependent oxidoreductase [Pseudomonadota bacterium]